MFDSAFNDGVKRPGMREMTAMLAGLIVLTEPKRLFARIGSTRAEPFPPIPEEVA